MRDCGYCLVYQPTTSLPASDIDIKSFVLLSASSPEEARLEAGKEFHARNRRAPIRCVELQFGVFRKPGTDGDISGRSLSAEEIRVIFKRKHAISFNPRHYRDDV